jgi:hypothetical protein
MRCVKYAFLVGGTRTEKVPPVAERTVGQADVLAPIEAVRSLTSMTAPAIGMPAGVVKRPCIALLRSQGTIATSSI